MHVIKKINRKMKRGILEASPPLEITKYTSAATPNPQNKL